MEVRKRPLLNQLEDYEIRFENPIVPGSVTSGSFTIEGKVVSIDDDGKGNARIYTTEGGARQYLYETAGVVDYKIGRVFIPRLVVQRADPRSFDFRVQATPVSLDVLVKANKVLKIDPSSIFIEVLR
jgi:hypothetical protein